jgi:hypothetical protein
MAWWDGITGALGGATKAVTDNASSALNAVGGVATQGAAMWGGLPLGGKIAVGVLAAVGTALVANKVLNKEEENTQGRRNDWGARYQRGELGGQQQGAAQTR